MQKREILINTAQWLKLKALEYWGDLLHNNPSRGGWKEGVGWNKTGHKLKITEMR